MTEAEKDAWLAERRKGITGTDISHLLPQKAAGEGRVILDKLGLSSPFMGNDATRLGQLLEPYVANQWAGKFKKIITPGGLISHPDYIWAIGTPDYLYPNGGLEIKTGVERTFRFGVPKKYNEQCQWYALIARLNEYMLSAMIVPEDKSQCPNLTWSHEDIEDWALNQPRRDFEIILDTGLQEHMLELAERFLQRLATMRANRQ